MTAPVIAIGLNSADPELIEKWMRAGKLNNLKKLCEQGVYQRLDNSQAYGGERRPFFNTEAVWAMFQTGVHPDKSGYWGTIEYNPLHYNACSDPLRGGYDYVKYKPFYALGPDYRVITFDVPVAAVCAEVAGLQVVGWGGHYPFVTPGSSPANLLPEINGKYGTNKILFKDNGPFWDRRYLRWLETESCQSIRTRADICLDLMQRSPWDLLLAVITETHGASHDLWFMSRPDHPLHEAIGGIATDHDPLQKVFEEADRAIGKILAAAPEEANVICFSVHGMQGNVTDLANYVFLPELLYRWTFPGKACFPIESTEAVPDSPITGATGRYWMGEIWRRKCERNFLKRLLHRHLPSHLIRPQANDGLLFPYSLDFRGTEIGWMPAQWYRKSWPRMRAFALPSYDDGHIRINLGGRESHGLVAPGDYTKTCEQVTRFLLSVRNARSGRPMVREVIRTRGSAAEDSPGLPYADLIVRWRPGPADVVDSPDVGRIGPFPYSRTGGHRSEGFVIGKGPGLRGGFLAQHGEAIDLGPTILRLLGAPVPAHVEGRSLL